MCEENKLSCFVCCSPFRGCDWNVNFNSARAMCNRGFLMACQLVAWKRTLERKQTIEKKLDVGMRSILPIIFRTNQNCELLLASEIN
jgi:hypothetical protein